ncbi:hypothetical protein COD67_04210 [Bacillus cereus]|nr:hypothetical protein COI89_08345 [Bacillus cereus]PGU69674.1 hypothetical protein COD67_04210 [Bacillus cereus]
MDRFSDKEHVTVLFFVYTTNGNPFLMETLKEYFCYDLKNKLEFLKIGKTYYKCTLSQLD